MEEFAGVFRGNEQLASKMKSHFLTLMQQHSAAVQESRAAKMAREVKAKMDASGSGSGSRNGSGSC